jgi:phosphohistidine phosphatase SixA
MIRIFVIVLSFLIVGPATATEAGWALLRSGGQIVLLRHGYAPGSGEPANFDIENCATQRNLSDRGQQQARRIGALFAARAGPIDHVETSRFCRCRDTARIGFRDEEVIENEALDWIADDPGNDARIEQVRQQILSYSGSRILIMVTHEEMIRELVGAGAHEGEAVIVSRGNDALGVAGRIRFN